MNNELKVDFQSIYKQFENRSPFQKIGKVHSNVGNSYEVSLSRAIIGSNVEFVTEFGKTCSGEVIGINTAIATDGFSRSNAGVGFAIPINQAKRVMEDLISGGKVLRGYLGVYIEDLEESKANALGISSTKGAFVVMVVDESPAYKAGLKEKDVITALNSKPIDDSNQLRNDVSSMRPGNTVVFSIIRDELPLSISVVLGERPTNNSEKTFNPSTISYDTIGLKVGPNNDGVIVLDVDKKSIAYKNNIRKNDIITEIGKQQISSPEEYKNELGKYSNGDTIMLRIIKNGQPRYEAFEIK